MKNFILAFLSIGLITVLSGFTWNEISKSKSQLTISWEFKNVDKVYDHENKCKVWIDGQYAGESSEAKETRPNSIKINTSQGSHEIKIMNYSFYEGKWEEHTLANDFGINCVFEEWLELKKKTKLKIIFDMNEGVTYSVE